jgi:hypothetical protein
VDRDRVHRGRCVGTRQDVPAHRWFRSAWLAV